jgi:hypothetical protein
VISRDGVLSEPFTLVNDHYARIERLGPTLEQQRAALDYVRARSHQRLVQPYAHLTVPDDAEIMRLVADGDARLKAPDRTAFLDEWLAGRAAVRQDSTADYQHGIPQDTEDFDGTIYTGKRPARDSSH